MRCRVPLLLFFLILLSPTLSPGGFAQTPAPKPLMAHPEVQALLDQGRQAAQESRWDAARRIYNDALQKAQSMQDKQGQSLALGNLGIVCKEMGQTQQAISYYEQALPIFRELDDRRGEGGTLINI